MSDHIHNMAIDDYDTTETTYLNSGDGSTGKGKSTSTDATIKRRMRVKDEYDNNGLWDPSFLLKHNPDQLSARAAVQQLTTLARKFESIDSHEDYLSSYERMKTHLIDKSSFLSRNKSSRHEKSKCFEKLYSSALDQMSSLIAMAKETSDDDGEDYHKYTDSPKSISTTGSTEMNVVPGEYSKKDFTEYMNKWLKENWTNPYPDDDGLAEIAITNGTSPTTVSNWLINARTRKWRPAIVKAYESGRPSEMLKVDSIDIFDGKPVPTEKLNVVQP